MAVGIFGESGTGKSGLAEELRKLFPAEVYTGNDYLRLAKSEDAAREAFRKLLEGGGGLHLCGKRAGTACAAAGVGLPDSGESQPGDHPKTLCRPASRPPAGRRGRYAGA